MDAKFWDFEELVKLSADEVKQLIANLEQSKGKASHKGQVTSANAAIKRAQFVLQACGNLLCTVKPVARDTEQFAGFERAETATREYVVSQAHLLMIVHVQRLLCASRKPNTHKDLAKFMDNLATTMGLATADDLAHAKSGERGRASNHHVFQLRA